MAGPEPIQDTINVERTPTFGSGNTITQTPAEDDASGPTNGGGRASRYFARGGKLRPFRLLKEDVINLKSRYLSDWQVFNQQVVASAVYIFFTNLLPGITFASDLYTLTGKSWGTIEVVFSTGLCGLIFSLFSGQPLTILGVTGPFSVLAENIYELCDTHFHVEFLPVMAWSLIHAGWMHYLLAIFNAHDWTMQYVTHFSADIFSLLNSVIYFHKAAMELKRTHTRVSLAAFLYAVLGAVGTCLLAILLSTANSWKPMFHRYVRLGLTEYAAAISIIIWIGIPYIGELASLDHIRLEVQTSFRPTNPDRTTFFVRFWEIPIEWVFLSMIPGAIVTVLFYFDHEISSIICTVERYGTKKPGGYAWDVALLGTTTILCGILGIPPANGLLPQAPLHSESLMHYVIESPPAEEGEQPDSPRPVARTYEQRYSHFIQASLILIFVSPPLQKLLGLTQTSVLAGLFLFMGYQSLSVNPILERVVNLLTPPSDLPALPDNVSWFGIHMYTIAQIIITGIVFGVTLTVAAPAFPLIIIALVPVRLSLIATLPVLLEGASSTDDYEIIPTCKQLGVFAKEDIAPGEVVLKEYSLLTANNRLKDSICDACSSDLPPLGSENEPVSCPECYDTVFCTQYCFDQAMERYHPAVCEKDVDAIAKDPDAFEADQTLYLLLLSRVLAIAAHEEVNPLDVREVKYIWGDFVPTRTNDINVSPNAGPPPEWTLPFSFKYNIETPLHVLEKMDIDIYSSLAENDLWVLNTLYAKFRGTASARKNPRDGRPDVAAVHPYWCLANHDCDPNVTWEWGGRMVLEARKERVVGGRPGGIKKGEEILNHYCDVNLPVQQRREWARGSLGGWCMCKRCRDEAAMGEANHV